MFAVFGALLGFLTAAAVFIRKRTWRIGYENMSNGELWAEAIMTFTMSILAGCIGALIGLLFEQSPAVVIVLFIALAFAAGVVAAIRHTLGRLEDE